MNHLNQNHRGWLALLVTLTLSLGSLMNSRLAQANDVFSNALDAVRAVKLNGEGHEQAVVAMKTLNAATADQIPLLLEAMDGVNPISLNWLRSAINQAVRKSDGTLPQMAIKKYFEDQSHHPQGRLLAFNLLTGNDDELRLKMIQTLGNDRSMPLRYLAIDEMIERATKTDDEGKIIDRGGAIAVLAQALEKARDVDQIQTIAGHLAGLGVQIDLQKQMGFVSQWSLVGNFNNKDMQGFDVAAGPEDSLANIDLGGKYVDVDGKEVSWNTTSTVEPTGVVDLNESIGKIKGVSAYAYTTFDAADGGKAQFRIGTPNATKVWLNGKLVMNNEIYHNSNSIDKFVEDVELNEGENKILIKVCQNEQTESWAQEWRFQFRICDNTGKPIAKVKKKAASY